jgi:hypothetical protein
MIMDPATIEALNIPPPPWRPPLVEERPWLSRAAQDAERIARKHSDAFARYAEDWFATLERAKATLDSMPLEPLSAEELFAFDRLIEEIEASAEQRATQQSRMAKRVRRDHKKLFAEDPSLAAVERAFASRVFATDDRIIEALLDYALFLRAFRAERDPEARGGPTFDDPAALKRHLDALIGA